MLEALDEVAKLIVSTPATDLVSDLDKAAMTIQKNFRGAQARKEAKTKAGTGGGSAAVSKGGKSSPMPGSAPAAAGGKGTPAPEGAMPKMQSLFSALDASGDGTL